MRGFQEAMAESQFDPSHRICVGKIVGVHGVRGLVKIKSETAVPQDCAQYGPVANEAGDRQFDVTVTGFSKGVVLAKIAGISDRDAAFALKGTLLYVSRAVLPEPEEEEFYHADLIGLAVELPDGRAFGRVRALHDFGAGDLIELSDLPALPDYGEKGQKAGGSVILPFTKAVVPIIDLERQRLVVDPPQAMFGGETADDKALWADVLKEQGSSPEERCGASSSERGEDRP